MLDSAAIICTTGTASLVATNLTIGDSLTYNWLPNGNILSGQGTDSIVVAPYTTTTYSATATNQYGCTTTAQTIVAVSLNNPPLSISASTDTMYIGTDVQLIATQQAGYSYSWASDPTLSSTIIYNPIATPEATTTYYLTITDAWGCTTMDSITIYVTDGLCGEPNIFVPNAFTPDDDGHNDVFYVEGVNITDLKLIIYNRWGEQVFQSNAKSMGWDGTFKGKDCPTDVYGYYMECRCLDGNEFTKKGNITLLR